MGALAYNPRNGKVYCANSSDRSVTIIDADNNRVIATDTTGLYPNALCYNPASNQVFVCNNKSNSVSAIDGATDRVVATVGVGSAPVALCLNPSRNQIYVANKSGYSISVIGTYSGVQEREASTALLPTFEFFPNPCHGVVSMRFRNPPSVARGASNEPLSAGCRIDLHDVAGRLVKIIRVPQTMIRDPQSLDLRDLSGGVYFVSVSSRPGLRAKLVLQR